jgi:hypothetical protein
LRKKGKKKVQEHKVEIDQGLNTCNLLKVDGDILSGQSKNVEVELLRTPLRN